MEASNERIVIDQNDQIMKEYKLDVLGIDALQGTNESSSKRITSNRMTIYEKTHIIGVRASQLSDDAPPLVYIGDMTDCLEIATQELIEKKLPFIIRRKFPDGSYEDWSIDELLIPDVDF